MWYTRETGDVYKSYATALLVVCVKAMRDYAPELFDEQPDLLFQLVTMIAPEVTISNQDARLKLARGTQLEMFTSTQL